MKELLRVKQVQVVSDGCWNFSVEYMLKMCAHVCVWTDAREY